MEAQDKECEAVCHRMLVCQQKKDHGGKKLTEPNSMEVPERRWGSLATDFIVGLPKTKDGFDCTTTWVDRSSRKDQSIPTRESDTAIDVANYFFSNLFKHHACQIGLSLTGVIKSRQKCWNR